jgi:hypothetical protein
VQSSEKTALDLCPHSPLAYPVVAWLADFPGRAAKSRSERSNQRLRKLEGVVPTSVHDVGTTSFFVGDQRHAR